MRRLWGDSKSKECLILAELELDTCQDQHPCSSSPVELGELQDCEEVTIISTVWMRRGCGLFELSCHMAKSHTSQILLVNKSNFKFQWHRNK